MQASTDIAIHTVAILDRGEVSRGQVFHDGHLWEVHSTGGVASYRIDVHRADGVQVLASARGEDGDATPLTRSDRERSRPSNTLTPCSSPASAAHAPSAVRSQQSQPVGSELRRRPAP